VTNPFSRACDAAHDTLCRRPETLVFLLWALLVGALAKALHVYGL
jgi:hypothetical protein